ncbi:MAG: plasmid recombination protein [Vibrio cyclitrophicus]
MGYQFIRVETYARIPSRNHNKQSAKAVADECERVPGACPHVEDPKPSINIFGCRPSEAVQLAEERAEIAKDSRGRKLRKDAQIILGGIVSYPTPMSELNPNCKEFRKWIKLNHNFLKKKFGENYKSMEFHREESFPHMHYYLVPPIDKNGRMNIGEVHQGIYARDNCSSKKAKDKMRAYKEAMRQFQQEYYEKVGKPCGLTKEGAHKRRLTRKEWKTEQSAAKRLAESLHIVDDIENQKQIAIKLKKEAESKKEEAKAFSKRAISVFEKAKEEKAILIALKSKKLTTVAHLKDKVGSLTKSINNLITKVNLLEKLNKGLKSKNSSLEKENTRLYKVNSELNRQNNLRERGIKSLKSELVTVLSHARAGTIEQIDIEYYTTEGNYYEQH